MWRLESEGKHSVSCDLSGVIVLKYVSACERETDRRTDGRTDGWEVSIIRLKLVR